MDLKALQKKYQQLLIENNSLKDEIKRLKALPGLKTVWEESEDSLNTVCVSIPAPEPELFDQFIENKTPIFADGINYKSSPGEKVRLFMSMFRGREDVYAKRWENKVKGTAGYSPACKNEWVQGIC